MVNLLEPATTTAITVGTVPNPDIRVALKQLKARAATYARFCNYYDGDQPLTFESQTYRENFSRRVASFQENVCPAVVNSISDRLRITGWEVEDTDVAPATPDEETDPADAEATAAAVWNLWTRDRMSIRAGEVHKTASKCGDAYVIVWPDPNGRPRVYPQDPGSMTVKYDADLVAIAWGAKFWLEERARGKVGRMNLYYANRIEKYETLTTVRSGFPGDNVSWQPATVEPGDAPVLANKWGIVPVFHFASNADIASFGESDLKDVLPLQDALNKATADMLVGMEFAALPQRWATGLQVQLNPLTGKPESSNWVPGVQHVWTGGDDTKFGEFSAADLTQLLEVQRRFKDGVADVSGVPAHYLRMNPTAWPSGESLKTAEARFITKITDRQDAYGAVWSDVMSLVLIMNGTPLTQGIAPLWTNASPRSDLDMAQTAVLKKQFGVSNEQLQREMGYSEEQIENMAQESAAASDAQAERDAQALNRSVFPMPTVPPAAA